ncbi:class I SAM-dependent methyltransferase [Methanobacterium sp. CWC-01]|uniref:class I SAM-dependent methyltransferase n=1 Tax=Methanobacterium aridiramus TaxID=2584467 RepID=UPI0025782F67|nr:class I SAM-dependent methyltransferase [Methanobacterium sp. CWC-01]WJI10165.1 class I SAM-dependent methyltransferase [Methanobacterium sp. CWC-01]
MRNRESKKLKEFYEKNYERDSDLFEIPHTNDFMYAQVINQILPYLHPGIKILDLGCNTGILSFYMAKKGCEVLGVDLASNAIESAKINKRHHKIENVQFESIDFILDWKKEKEFDLILCNQVIEHIPRDDLFLNKIFLSLKEKGDLILFTPTSYSSLAILSKKLTGKCYHDEEVGHLRRYNRKGIQDLIKGIGFEINKVVFLDSALRDWFIIYKPLRRFNTIFSLPIVRNVFNAIDTILAKLFLFPATICIHAHKK